ENSHVLASIANVGDSLGGNAVALLELLECADLVAHPQPIQRQTQSLHSNSRAERGIARERHHRDAAFAKPADRLSVAHTESLGPAELRSGPHELGVGECAVDVDGEK